MRRQNQAETITKIIGDNERPNSSFILTGDMNDPPTSPCIQAMLNIEGNDLLNALENPIETRTPKTETQGPGPLTIAWTYRRTKHGGDGSDHDPAWVKLDM